MKAIELELLETYIIVIEPGESLVKNLEKFVISKEETGKKIGFAWINMLGGGLEKVEFVFSVGYDVGYKKREKIDDSKLECNVSVGCIAWDSENLNEPMVHLHGDFIDEKLDKTRGGHLVDIEKVGLTMEIRLDVLSRRKLTRDLHPLVNVKLLNPPVYSFTNSGQSDQSVNNNQEGSQQEEIKKLREELKSEREKNHELRKQNTKLSELLSEVTSKSMVAQIEISPKS